VQIEHLFGGSALQRIEADGRVRLPRFVRETAARRGDAGALVIAAHESDPCLTGYDPAFRQLLFVESERQRLGDRPQPTRLRRLFGLSDEARIERGGRIVLPPMLRRLARLDRAALFVGTGGAFEIWDPEAAAASGDPALAELAGWHLSEIRPQLQQEEE
jgi:MraZ protein